MATFTYLGKQVYYTVDGQGPAMVLLNGIMMSTRSWEPFVPALSANNKLIRLDMLDQGHTDKVPDLAYTQMTQVDLIVALLDHLAIEKAHVVGISYGGEVAIQMAIAYPNRIDRLVLFNTTAYTTTWLAHIGHSWNAVGKTRDGEAYYKTTIPVIYSQQYYENRLDWMTARKQILVPIFSNPEFLDAIERLTNSAEQYDVRERLGEISAKTLIVAAEEDILTPKSDQMLLHRCITTSELISIPNCGHASMYEKPLLFTSLIVGFLTVTTVQYSF